MGNAGLTKAIALGVLVMAAGCTTQAIDTVETTSMAQTKDISRADLEAGKSQFRDANYGLAEKHFRKAVELRASNAEAWMGLAASYDQLGRFDFADRAYDQLVKLADAPSVVTRAASRAPRHTRDLSATDQESTKSTRWRGPAAC